jgi:ATP-binding cassette, subfamily C (CFTR/MRP), member 1
MMPLALSTATDARNAFGRIRHVFVAEQVAEPYAVDPEAEKALVVKNATFVWESAPASDASDKKAAKANGKEKSKSKRKGFRWWSKKKKVVAVEVELEPEGKNETIDEGEEDKKLDKRGDASEEAPTTTVAENLEQHEQKSLELCDIDFEIPRGQLCAIVGPGLLCVYESCDSFLTSSSSLQWVRERVRCSRRSSAK